MSTFDEGSPGPDKKKRRKYVSRACTVCRRRRTKCDGEARCHTCITHDQECVYDQEHDGRKVANKTYVEALVSRVRQLEQELESSQARMVEQGRGGVQLSISPRTVGASGSLRVDGGSLTYHGPSSAYMLVPDSAERLELEEDERNDNPHPLSNHLDLVHMVQFPSKSWDRHLPPHILPTAEVHEKVLDVFFCYLNDWCSVVDEQGFRSGLLASANSSSNTHKNAHYSPLLHNAILALATSRCSEIFARAFTSGQITTLIDSSAAAAAFAQRARWLIEEEAVKPMTSTAKGIMLLGSYHSVAGSISLGWFYEGMAVRMAQANGLNADCTSLVERGVIPQRLKTIRDRALWTIYVQDHIWTLSIGRTAGITEDDIETPLPLIDPELDARVWRDHHDKKRIRMGEPPVGQVQSSWASSTFLHTIKLFMLADKMRQTLYRMRSRHNDDTRRSIVSELHLDYAAWLYNLPDALCVDSNRADIIPPPHILMMHATFRYFQILLHRPRYTQPRATGDEDWTLAFKTCNTAADEIMKLVELHEIKPGVRYASTGLINIVFAAGTIHLLYDVQSSLPSSRTGGKAQVIKSIDMLRRMSWRSAHAGADILRQMLDEWTPMAPVEPTVHIDPFDKIDLFGEEIHLPISAPPRQPNEPVYDPDELFHPATQDGLDSTLLDIPGFGLDPFNTFEWDPQQYMFTDFS